MDERAAARKPYAGGRHGARCVTGGRDVSRAGLEARGLRYCAVVVISVSLCFSSVINNAVSRIYSTKRAAAKKQLFYLDSNEQSLQQGSHTQHSPQSIHAYTAHPHGRAQSARTPSSVSTDNGVDCGYGLTDCVALCSHARFGWGAQHGEPITHQLSSTSCDVCCRR